MYIVHVSQLELRTTKHLSFVSSDFRAAQIGAAQLSIHLTRHVLVAVMTTADWGKPDEPRGV